MLSAATWLGHTERQVTPIAASAAFVLRNDVLQLKPTGSSAETWTRKTGAGPVVYSSSLDPEISTPRIFLYE